LLFVFHVNKMPFIDLKDTVAVKSAERTLQILETFAAACEPMALSELARRIAIPVSACHGLVRTLESRGYLYEAGPRRAYYPTLRWLEKARAIAAHDPLAKRLAPILEDLAQASGETVVLGRRLESMVLYLIVIESRHPIRYSAQVGDMKPLHSSSAGKALLGALADAERAALLDTLKLARVTPSTITKREALEKDLAAGRARGWYATRGENVPDVHALAAQVRIAGQDYAVVIAGPAHRMDEPSAAHVKRLLRACKAIEALG
jgi:IclR family transcriptional regulator, acetate operon repressor